MMTWLKQWFGGLRRSPRTGEARVVLTDGGFEVVQYGEVVCCVRWSEVKEVFAFKLDLLTTDCICLGFRVSDAGDYCRVDEEMPGYAELVEAMPRALPGCKEDWWSPVAFPAFATNLTTVWGKPLP
jgi:hypothetical protein